MNRNEITQPREIEQLKGTFSLWCHIFNESSKIKKNIKSSDYEVALTKIGTFNDKKTFWSIYQHLKKPKDCDPGVEFELFKEGIRPVWEDETNIDGGKFTLLLEKDYSSLMWEEIMFAFCGGVIPYFEEFNGVCLSIRKTYDVAQFWFSKFERNKCTLMRNSIKKFFQVPPMVNMKMKTFTKLDPAKKENQSRNDLVEYEDDCES